MHCRIGIYRGSRICGVVYGHSEIHPHRNSLVLLLVCASPLETLFLELFRAHRSTPRFSSNSRQTCSHHGHLPRWPHRRDHQGSMRLPPHAEHCGHHGRWHCGSQTLLLELFLVHRPNQRCPSRSLQPRSHQNHLQRCPHRLDYQGSKCLHTHAVYCGHHGSIQLRCHLWIITFVLSFEVLSVATVKYLYRSSLVLLLACTSPLEVLLSELFKAHSSTSYSAICDKDFSIHFDGNDGWLSPLLRAICLCVILDWYFAQ
mmetsp:Transcript_29109/g.64370  ORF Transcript_29109/g.64370 Transcript_29109/m.64370 type:complete len:258 (-) Transcript_29109:122-895(-)